MAYLPPYIDAAGLHTSSDADIEQFLKDQAAIIFGTDVYLENDAQDYQLMAAFALVAYHCLQSSHYAYDARSPITANDNALDGVVTINGITRDGTSYSTVPLDLVGTPYTLITQGRAGDNVGTSWLLPDTVNLGATGMVTVTAIAALAGPTIAVANSITIIQTPTAGWATVNNSIAASVGRPVESNADLRSRQAVSVQNPSQGLATGIKGGVLAVPNVNDCLLVENDTNLSANTINGVTNPSGFPPHSITLVVDGGDTTAIAGAIANRKTPGCFSNGDQVTTVLDRYGDPTTIRFYRPSATRINVNITVKALQGYSTAITAQIKQAISDYLNKLSIGQSVIISELWAAATSVTTGQAPAFSISSLAAGINPATPGTTDIALNFNQRTYSDPSYVTVTVT